MGALSERNNLTWRCIIAIADAAQALASEQEYVRPELENYVLQQSVLLKEIQKSKIKAVSDRPSRIPTMPSLGGKPRVGNMNGADLGIGSGPTQVPGQITPVCYIDAFSYSKQAEYATDSDEKAIENFATLTRTLAPERFADFLETVLQGDGSNTIDTVVALQTTGGNITGINVNSANLFLDDQDLDVWTSIGGTFVTTITVQDSDISSNVIWLLNPVPTGTITAGMKLLVSGSSGQANTGLNGLRYYQVGTNTGNWLTVQRSAWNGKYIAQTQAVNGALTPQIVRAIHSQIQLAMGKKKADADDLVAHATVNEQNAWEQNALLVQRIDMSELKGSESEDMLKREASTTIGGRRFLINERAVPGYIDFLALKNASMVETKSIDFYDVGGQTLFGLVGASGGQASGLVFYMVAEMNLVWVQTRMNAFLSGIAIEKGLYGQ
jgi:hypothetical protein